MGKINSKQKGARFERSLASKFKEYGYEGDRIEVVHAPEIISPDETPTMAIRRKKDSSLVAALNILKERDDVVGMVSAGSTGAVLAGGLFIVGRMEGTAFSMDGRGKLGIHSSFANFL